MIAKVSLNETDVATVKVGQKATLTFDAIENLTITGEVVEIDAVGTASQGVVTYNVKISFDTQDTRIKPGMSTTASIITNSKSDILIVPNGAIKTQGDISYVESFQTTSANSSADTSGNTKSSTVNSSSEQVITSSNPPSQIQIETGLANDSYTEITSGLNEGDQIVTRTITSAKTTTTTSTKSAFSMGMGGGPGR
ncbi:HlyD family efflux transporter periplasmic adaptor subunit [Candidatus Gracilibacteria bacterium]|nr:HlyD family efflux transporter periplasmic adaptor subunit [Candidatus Gracilibacteria bacterium]